MDNEELEKKCMDLYDYLANNFKTPFDAIMVVQIPLNCGNIIWKI